MKLTGAQILCETLERSGRTRYFRLSGRRDSSGLRRNRQIQAASHSGASRTGRHAHGRRLCACYRRRWSGHGDVGPRRDEHGHWHCHCDARFFSGGLHHRAGEQQAAWDPTRSRKWTSPASPCRSRSTTLWSPRWKTLRARSARLSSSRTLVGPARYSWTSPRTRNKPPPNSSGMPAGRKLPAEAPSQKSRSGGIRSRRGIAELRKAACDSGGSRHHAFRRHAHV